MDRIFKISLLSLKDSGVCLHLILFPSSLIPLCYLTLFPIQDGAGGGGGGGGGEGSPSSFSPVTSTNVGLNPQNFLIFSFDPFATLM